MSGSLPRAQTARQTGLSVCPVDTKSHSIPRRISAGGFFRVFCKWLARSKGVLLDLHRPGFPAKGGILCVHVVFQGLPVADHPLPLMRTAHAEHLYVRRPRQKQAKKSVNVFFANRGMEENWKSVVWQWNGRKNPCFFQKSCVLGDFLLNPNKLMVQVEAKEKLLHNFCKYDILLLIRYMLTF